jgi:hypothetical protein
MRSSFLTAALIALAGTVLAPSRADAQYYERRFEGRGGYGGPGPHYRGGGRSGLICVVAPQFRQYRRSCAAASNFVPGQYCECVDGPNHWPGRIAEE